MSSSPDDKPVDMRPVGRGRGGRPRGRSVSPGSAVPSSLSRSPECTERVALARPGSRSPPLVASMAKVGIRGSSASPTRKPADEANKRGAKRGDRSAEFADDMIHSRPAELVTKQGTKGNPMRMLTNYFKLKKAPTWTLHGYHVYFEPEVDGSFLRKMLLKHNEQQLGPYIFDGMKLFCPKQLEGESPHTFTATERNSQKVYNIILKYVGSSAPGDPLYMQFYSIILRKCLFGMALEELGRHFYDRKAAIEIPSQRLVLWPGYVTSLRQHENDTLLCVETTHKVLRLDNCLTVLNSVKEQARGDPNDAIARELKDTIVMTSYNRKTYRVDDVDFSVNPKSTFDIQGVATTYVQYYQQRYAQQITDMKQPMLVCRPSKKDLHRGFEGNILLVPEFCQLTGLTDAMRANFSLMKELSKHLHMGPVERVATINRFMSRLRGTQVLTEDLQKWGLEFDSKLTPVEGRILARETMLFATGTEPADDKGDWTKAFRSQKMLTTVNLTRWAVIVPQRDAGGVENLTRTMSKVSLPLDMKISNPAEVFKLQDIKGTSYVRAINTLTEKYNDLQMLFVILPNNKLETYSIVKKRLAVDLGIPSQCFVARNVTSKGLMSIATKVVVQMNAKLGGEPWSIKLPLKNLMVVGFDVYHGAKGTKGGSIGALVSTLSPSLAKYFSTTSVFNSPVELSKTMLGDFTKALQAYQQANGVLPDRIVMFRDGVGEGQLIQVYQVELEQLKNAINELYQKGGLPEPKFTFIVVTKKINSRVFADIRGKIDNPPPGAIVDDVITIPERYDFFLVSCAARQGTVSPCSYNVLFDNQGLDPDKIQMMTYKMCHMYFNWSGTVAVPAPCQFAHKLAFITGTAYGARANPNLSNYLHFL